MSRYENKSVKDIAAHLDLTEKAVEYHITKSPKFIKEHLDMYYNNNWVLNFICEIKAGQRGGIKAGQRKAEEKLCNN